MAEKSWELGRAGGYLDFVVTALVASCVWLAAAGIAHAAAPEVGRCVKVLHGSYENTGCTKANASTGKYEWEPGLVKTGLTLTGKYEYFNFATSPYSYSMDCLLPHGTASLSGPDAISGLVIHSSECKEETTGLPICTTPGLGSGETKTTALSGEFGYITRSPVKVGLALNAPEGEPFIDAGCPGLTSLWGGVITNDTKANVMGTSTVLIYKITKKVGFQQYTHFEGEPQDILTFNEPTGRAASLESQLTLSFEEKAEVRALP